MEKSEQGQGGSLTPSPLTPYSPTAGLSSLGNLLRLVDFNLQESKSTSLKGVTVGDPCATARPTSKVIGGQLPSPAPLWVLKAAGAEKLSAKGSNFSYRESELGLPNREHYNFFIQVGS